MRILSTIAGLLIALAAQAQESVTIGEALRGFLQVSEQQCKQIDARAEREKEGKELALQLTMDDGRNVMCGCMPERTSALLKELPAEELSRRVSTQEEMLAVLRPKVMNPCMAEMMRRMYTYRCEDRFGSMMSGGDLPRLCACLKEMVDKIPESQATEIGLAAAEWIPRAAAAKKNGESVPARPAVLDPVMNGQEQCAAKYGGKKAGG